MRRKITRIIDGDTVCYRSFFRNEIKVRVLGIDCPEKKLDKKNGVDEYHKSVGMKVKDFVERILLNKKVKLKYAEGQKDFYGRELCSIKYKKISFAEFLIHIGYAKKFVPKDKDKRGWSRKELDYIHDSDIEENIRLFNELSSYKCFCF
jgi:endonuclease YncB( thermonuclease family)